MYKNKNLNRSVITALAVGCFMSGAMAQSSVTIYGVMDLGVRITKNGSLGSMTTLSSGNNLTSRFGFRGTEDLGGGLSAGFILESGVAADVGSAGTAVPAGTFFNRVSILSLTSTSLGEIRVGRDYVPTWSATVSIDPFGGVGVGAFPNLLSQTSTRVLANAFGPPTNASSLTWVNNSVQFRSPKVFGGFYGNLIVASRENQATSASGSSLVRGARLGFQDSKIDASISHVTTDNTLVAGATFNDDVLSGSYDFGFVNVRAIHRVLRFQSDKQVTTMLGMTAPLNLGVLKFSITKANQSGPIAAQNANDATQVAAGYVYNFSKRTAIYGHAARISNKGQASFAIPGGIGATVANFGGQKSAAYEVGLRTSF